VSKVDIYTYTNLDPVERDIAILPQHRIVVLEGNYILLNVSPWDKAAALLDEKWFIIVERDVARARVIQRHLLSGLAETETEAAKRFDENDWPNGIFLLENSNVQEAQRKIRSIQDSELSNKCKLASLS
jgi:pantothenate kinase